MAWSGCDSDVGGDAELDQKANSGLVMGTSEPRLLSRIKNVPQESNAEMTTSSRKILSPRRFWLKFQRAMRDLSSSDGKFVVLSGVLREIPERQSRLPSGTSNQASSAVHGHLKFTNHVLTWLSTSRSQQRSVQKPHKKQTQGFMQNMFAPSQGACTCLPSHPSAAHP